MLELFCLRRFVYLHLCVLLFWNCHDLTFDTGKCDSEIHFYIAVCRERQKFRQESKPKASILRELVTPAKCHHQQNQIEHNPPHSSSFSNQITPPPTPLSSTSPKSISPPTQSRNQINNVTSHPRKKSPKQDTTSQAKSSPHFPTSLLHITSITSSTTLQRPDLHVSCFLPGSYHFATHSPIYVLRHNL